MPRRRLSVSPKPSSRRMASLRAHVVRWLAVLLPCAGLPRRCEVAPTPDVGWRTRRRSRRQVSRGGLRGGA
eukprot:1472797-Pyramimonas_sp.AAC.1